MTTIAWDGRMLAADGMSVWGAMKVRSEPKIVQIDGKTWMAGAGRAEHVAMVVEWVRDGCLKPRPLFRKDEGVNIMVVRVDDDGFAQLTTMEEELVEVSHGGGPLALGSGGHFAMAAMHLGKSAMDAVRVANALCSSSGMGGLCVWFPGGQLCSFTDNPAQHPTPVRMRRE